MSVRMYIGDEEEFGDTSVIVFLDRISYQFNTGRQHSDS
jgi:hypothetical protein